MANNRMYLRCKCHTDRGVFLGKHMLSGWYINRYHIEGKEVVEHLWDYFEKHEKCFFDYFDKNGTQFELAYEDGAGENNEL